jgi:hypothetical protein
VHVDEGLGVVLVAQPVDVPLDAFLEDVVVPGRVACLAAEDEGDGWVEQFEGFCPLVGLLGVVLFR